MALKHIHSLLIHPAKGEDEQPDIGGTSVPLSGKLGEMLRSVYDRARSECDIEIVFRRDDSGAQHNECRADIVAFTQSPSLPKARRLAARLQTVTTHRSGLGLLFLMTGHEAKATRLVMSRFPADQGIIAEEQRDRLSVEFIERVFMKSAKAYKSAVYQGESFDRGFWDGRAIDRQISGPKEISDYWIRDFLVSELRTTGPAGTKRLATAFRSAIRDAEELSVRQELIAAATLSRGQHKKVATARQFVEDLGLSTAAAAGLERQLPRVELMDDVFEFDAEEFNRHLHYRLVELDNGAVLMAEDRAFDDVFEREAMPRERVRYSTQGRVVDERLRTSR
jgi:hypothetical protein